MEVAIMGGMEAAIMEGRTKVRKTLESLEHEKIDSFEETQISSIQNQIPFKKNWNP